MGKPKVHELATELGVDYKKVVSYLRNKGYDAMTGVTTVPDQEVANIRSRFGTVKPEVKPEIIAPKASQQAAAAPAKTEEAPKKKSKGIVLVGKRAGKAAKPEASAPEKAEAPKTEAPKAEAPKAEAPKAEAPKTEAPKTEAPKAAEAPQTAPAKAVEPKKEPETKKPAAREDMNRAPRQNTERGDGQTRRDGAQPRQGQYGDRTPRQGQGQYGDRAPRQGQYGDRAPRQGQGQYGDRAPRQGQYGDRTARPAGQGQYGDRTARPAGQGQTARTGGRPGDTRPSYGQNAAGTGRTSYGDRAPRQGQFGDRTGRPAGQGMSGDRRTAGGQGTRTGYGQGTGRDGRPSYGDRTGRPGTGAAGDRGARPGFGQGSAARGARGGAAARPSDGDGALVHKTTRDYRKDNSKEYERSREERKENGKHSQFGTNRPNQQKKQFNRVPKALQQNTPKASEQKEKEVVTEIRLPERLTVRELAEAMKMAPAQLVKDLFMKGEMVTVNHEIPFEKAQEIAMDYDIIAEQEEKEDVIGALLAESEESEDDMVPRPPVVCVMGHVDHGKTSLLDAIRNTHVTDREAGGITQHIGAYMVSINGQKITFLDTPGHEAFTAMRMRGANSTDIAVLVVAADDGVMPQTIEAINHAKAANVDVIVAVNKIDKPGANVERVKQELAEKGLLAEEWGGSTIFCPVSAKTHEGIDNLLEMILLTAEMKELKANPNRKARGLVLEAKLDKGRGPVATILIQKGTLRQGDFIACGAASGKVRAMNDEKGKRLTKATPSMPVEIIGLSAVPAAGEVLVSLDSDKEAKAFAATFISEGKKSLIEETKTQMSLDDLFNQIKEGNLKELPIVVKADVQGSVEAVRQSLVKLSNEEVVVKVIHGGVGAISESDVNLASASNAIIIGFNVKVDAAVKAIADAQKVDIHLYSVIYEAIEDVERALNGMKAAVYEEKVLGHAEIRQMFKASGVGNIAGAYVKDGVFQRKCKIRVFRGDEQLYDGSLASLKRFKDDVKEVREGFECGLVFDGWDAFQVDDTVLAYTMVEVPRT